MLIKKSFTARLASFFALLCLFLNGYLFLFLGNFAAVPRDSIIGMALFSFAGLVLGSFLCPFFLPLPNTGNKKNKPLAGSIVFILLVMFPNILLRLPGVGLWLESELIRSVTALFSGILYPVGYGLFFLSFLQTDRKENAAAAERRANRTGMYCPLLFSLALALSLVFYNLSLYLIDVSAIYLDTAEIIPLIFNIMYWVMISMGVCTIACLILLGIRTGDTTLPETPAFVPARRQVQPDSAYTNWSFILRLMGIAAVFKSLNAAMEWQLYSFAGFAQFTYQPFFLLAALIISLLGFLSGRSMAGFLKWFLPINIVFLIILPGLMLFDEYPGFLLLLNTLAFILHNSIWVVFTVALIEEYMIEDHRGNDQRRFWFYGIAAAVHFTNIFTFISPLGLNFLPSGTKHTTLIMVISAALFMLLSFRLIFPKTPVKNTADLLPSSDSPKDNTQGIFIKTRQMSRFILFRDISYIEVIGHKVHFLLINGEETAISSTFQEILPKLLTDSRFSQCHRSYVVNMDEISSIENNVCLMNGNKKVPISKTYAGFKKHFMQFRGRDMQNGKFYMKTTF